MRCRKMYNPEARGCAGGGEGRRMLVRVCGGAGAARAAAGRQPPGAAAARASTVCIERLHHDMQRVVHGQRERARAWRATVCWSAARNSLHSWREGARATQARVDLLCSAGGERWKCTIQCEGCKACRGGGKPPEGSAAAATAAAWRGMKPEHIDRAMCCAREQSRVTPHASCRRGRNRRIA